MRIIEINKYNDFLALEETWQDVLQRSNHQTIFSTWEWLTCCWKHFGNNKRLVLLLVDDGSAIVGIAPLMYTIRKMFGLRQGKIEFIGTPESDYNDFILTDKKEQCMKLFMEFLYGLSEKWSCIELLDIPEDSQSLLLLRKLTKNLKLFHACQFVGLPKSYEALLDKLGARDRKSVRQGFRRLEKDFKVDFLDYSASESVSEGMNIFFDLHQERWNAAGLPGVFSDQESRSFHLDVARSFSEKGWLGLFVLELSGKPVAADYGFKYLGKFYSYLSGFDPKYSKYSVGSLLTTRIMRNCIENGLVEFDFMRGAEEFKDRWNARTRWNSQAIITRSGFLEDIEYRLYDKYWQQGSRLKYIVKNAPKTLARTLDKAHADH
jgi:CelD/BcsL family acetyltransferase involved in cellulose biosynthesis